MNKYDITFEDGTTRTIEADEHLVIHKENGSIQNWFVEEGEIKHTLFKAVKSIYKQEDCCDNCANGKECESKD